MKKNEIEKLLEEKKINEKDIKTLRKIVLGHEMLLPSECERLERNGVINDVPSLFFTEEPSNQPRVYGITGKFLHEIDEYFKKTKSKEY